jgi:hypothetical protein
MLSSLVSDLVLDIDYPYANRLVLNNYLPDPALYPAQGRNDPPFMGIYTHTLPSPYLKI